MDRCNGVKMLLKAEKERERDGEDWEFHWGELYVGVTVKVVSGEWRKAEKGNGQKKNCKK